MLNETNLVHDNQTLAYCFIFVHLLLMLHMYCVSHHHQSPCYWLGTAYLKREWLSAELDVQYVHACLLTVCSGCELNIGCDVMKTAENIPVICCFQFNFRRHGSVTGQYQFQLCCKMHTFALEQLTLSRSLPNSWWMMARLCTHYVQSWRLCTQPCQFEKTLM